MTPATPSPTAPATPHPVRALAHASLGAPLGALLAATLVAAPASADDTEVFFGQPQAGVNADPNVLFVLDTSGSMNEVDDGFEGTRADRLKRAMYRILRESENLNVGLMRLNGAYGGGAVIHPVAPLDRVTCEGEGCDLVELTRRIDLATDDVEEHLDGGRMEHGGPDTGNILSMGGRDASNEQLVGYRFRDLRIPRGARIESASIRFTAVRDGASNVRLRVRAEDVDDATTFGTKKRDLSKRRLTGAAVGWTPGPWTASNDYRSDDLSAIVQEVVDRPGWCGGNAMAFSVALDGAFGRRDAYSFDNGPGFAAALDVTYDASEIPPGGGCNSFTATAGISTGDDDVLVFDDGGINRSSLLRTPLTYAGDGRRLDLTAALRFHQVDVPADAEIESARLELRTIHKRTDEARVRIRADLSPNSPGLVSWDDHVLDRARTSASARWRPGVAEPGELATSTDVADVVAEVVARDGWAARNAMTFLLERDGGSGYRDFHSFDTDPNKAARLVIDYRAAEPPRKRTVRDELADVVAGMTSHHGTPVVDAYYEAAGYLLGRPVDYGRSRGIDWSSVRGGADYRSQYHRVSHPDAYAGADGVYRPEGCVDGNLDSWKCRDERILGAGASYVSPFEASCQSNHIVFLSDGAATSNSSADKVRALTGEACEDRGQETCGRELAAWLHGRDHDPDLARDQNVRTYTIGFNTGDGDAAETMMQDLADAGGGRFFRAESATELVGVFKDIIGEVETVDTTFVAPGATVNQFNRLTHRDDIYFAMFKPSERARWIGNLKQYRLGETAGGEVAIVDATGRAAVDPATGYFADSAVSVWSKPLVDGSHVALGGIAAELAERDPATDARAAYTWVGDGAAGPGGVDLTDPAQALHEDNAAITAEALGLDASADVAARRETLLKWARGIDVHDADDDESVADHRGFVGDPMHSRPVILNHRNATSSTSTVFVATNEGFLHAIDTATGDERYAFMPAELLGNINTLHVNTSGRGAHPYGLDGPLTIWSPDPEKDVTVDETRNEEAWLYVGMRRGGSNLYALDVSGRASPRLGWVIRGGGGDFAQLGQTWSQPKAARMMIDGAVRDVLVFGAGYDTANDEVVSDTGAGGAAVRRPDGVGRGIYVVDARTGERLWAGLGVREDAADGGSGTTISETDGSDADTGPASARKFRFFEAMEYSIPGDVRVIDVNQDGLADQLYAADMGGQLWRFDVNQYHRAGEELIDGGVMADFGGDAPEERRKFFYEPDVALIARDGERFLSIGIGSGWRSHPLDDVVEDRFYLVRTDAIETPPEGYGRRRGEGQLARWTPITEADLVNVTDDVDPETNPYGWFIEMEDDGQKVLAKAVTVNDQVLFTAYRPERTSDACSSAIGSSSVFVVDVLDGSPTLDLAGDGDAALEDASRPPTLDKQDRERVLSRGGIASEAAALIGEAGNVITVGPDQPLAEFDFGPLTKRTYWIDRGREAGADGVALPGVADPGGVADAEATGD